MHRDRLGADEELAADLAVAATLGDEREDLGLARSEAGARADDRDSCGAPPPSLLSSGAAPSSRAVAVAASINTRAPSASPVAASTSARWERTTASS